MRQAVHEPIESPIGPSVNLIRSFNLALRAMNRSLKPQETYLDVAILRVFIGTGGRLSEITNLKLDYVDLEHGLLHVFGKGRRPRILSIGKRTSRAMDRYLGVRTQHRDAMADWLWLGRGGGQRHVAAMTTLGIRQDVWRRESEANLGQVHPHQLWHPLAHDWLATPGNMEGDLMHLPGWRSRTTLSHYVTRAVSGRALEAHKRSSLSDRV